MFLHSMYCLICLFTHFMNDFDRKMFVMTDGFSATLLHADEISENMQIWGRGGVEGVR